jgi:tetratricopeptide (TPR) repeat protein
MQAAGAASDRALLSLHVGHWAYLQSHRSEYRAASATAEEGLRLALQEGDAYDYMACQFHRAWALLHLGEWAETHRVIRDGLQMAEQNGHALWARAFTFHMAWLHAEAGDFESARALCESALQSGREGQLGRLLGSIVLGIAQLGLGDRKAALRAFEDVTGRVDRGPVQMDWILQMPLRAGLSAYWLGGGEFGRAREEAEELCRLAATAGERTYLALGQRALAEAALGERDGVASGRGIAEALRAIAGRETPLAEWKVYATAARHEEAHGQPATADEYWARSAAALERLTASLGEEVALVRSFLATPAVQAVRHRVGVPDSHAGS